MFKKGFLLFTMSFLIIGSGFSQPNGQVNSPSSDSQVDAAKMRASAGEIEKLQAMPSKERLKYLKTLKPEVRRGLWLQLKKEKAGFEGRSANRAGQYAPEFQLPYPRDLSNKPWLNRAVGTISYDADFPSTGFGGGAIVGNRFNTHTGVPVFANGTVETVQAIVVPGPAQTSASAGFVLLGPQTTMGGAMALFSSFTTATGVIDTVSFTAIGANYTGSSFYVLFGDFANSYIPVFGTATNMGQGHHGVVGYTGGMGPNITGTFNFGSALNAFVRAGGNIVPVELMKFEVE